MTMQMAGVWVVLLAGVWFGARGGGRTYGAVFGVLCGALWAAVGWSRMVEADSAPEMVLIVACGLIVIVLGIIAGSSGTQHNQPPVRPVEPGEVYPRIDARGQEKRLARLTELPAQFGEWLDQYRQHADPWPAFEYHIRSTLEHIFDARDIAAYRVLDEGGLIVPLGNASPHQVADCLDAAEGIIGWVVRNARPYYDFVEYREEEVHERMACTAEHVSWCFPIIRSGCVVGVVTVGWLVDGGRDIGLLKLVAGLLAEQWGCVAEICRARVAMITDSASGVLTRLQFLREAPLVLQRSYRLSQPVSAAAFSITGLRDLDDKGYWALHDEAVASVGQVLRSRVRPEDRVGRFDDSRFVVLWHATDRSRAEGDASEIVARLEDIFSNLQKWRQEIRVSCGTASCANDYGGVAGLVSRAIAEAGEDGGNRERDLLSVGRTS